MFLFPCRRSLNPFFGLVNPPHKMILRIPPDTIRLAVVFYVEVVVRLAFKTITKISVTWAMEVSIRIMTSLCHRLLQQEIFLEVAKNFSLFIYYHFDTSLCTIIFYNILEFF